MNIPGIGEILSIVRQMPTQFGELINRLDRVITLLEETNEILREQSPKTR